MAAKYLGPAFDIHGGGVDLRFPHHENELAQSRAAGQAFASYWLHNAWITTAGEKMSKSLGNSLLIPEVLKRVRGIELRYYMVSAHYRSHVEFSFEALDDAAVGVPADRVVPRPRARRSRRPSAPRATSRQACARRSRAPWTTTSARRPRSRVIHDARARGQQAARRRRRRRRAATPAAVVRDARRARARPRRPGLGRRSAGSDDAQARRPPSTRWSPACSRSAPPRAPTRTGRAPTRSATGSPPPASRSRTPPTARSGRWRMPVGRRAR